MRRDRRRRACVWCAVCLAVLGISACKGRSASTAESCETETADPATEAEELATALVSEELPEGFSTELVLVDTFSSLSDQFVVKAGNYSWSAWNSEGEQVGGAVIACGSGPLDVDVEKAEALKVQHYNGMDGAPYLASFETEPDSLTVNGWIVGKAGDPEAEADVTISYDGTWDGQILELTPDMIYQILAVWDEDQAKERGFLGEAEYLVVTQ